MFKNSAKRVNYLKDGADRFPFSYVIFTHIFLFNIFNIYPFPRMNFTKNLMPMYCSVNVRVPVALCTSVHLRCVLVQNVFKNPILNSKKQYVGKKTATNTSFVEMSKENHSTRTQFISAWFASNNHHMNIHIYPRLMINKTNMNTYRAQEKIYKNFCSHFNCFVYMCISTFIYTCIYTGLYNFQP